MIEVKILATGSRGNCVYLSNGMVNVLVDVGLPKTRIEKIIIENGIDPTSITAVAITHEHQDHVMGLAFADKYKIPVYASEGTLKELDRLESGNIMSSDGFVTFNALDKSLLTISAFAVHHDAMEPFGYCISDFEGFKVSVLMDTGKVDEDMIRAMQHSHIYVFECNHDIDMLQAGAYPDITKSRILSDIGHLSNEAAAEALAKLVKGEGERICLTHMSSNNNTPKLAERAVKLALHEKGFLNGKHYKLEVV